ncbi:hypothetical protein [Kocuria rhizophila]|uniref:hypothetical protein n=1 Tax=Kocuria rhizophila TaxID=72000 RepID=UPI000A59E12B|nr:hypothetical protein [Kocuria rhizophila]
MSTQRPSPAVMRGRTDPAQDVRPVDYTSWRPSPATSGTAGEDGTGTTAAGNAAERGAGAASSPGRASDGRESGTPSRPGREAAEGGARAASSPGTPGAAAHVAPGGTPKPGPGPRPAPVAAVRDAPRVLTVDPQLAAMVAQLRAGVTPVTATPRDAFYTVDSGPAPSRELDVPADGVDVRGVWDVGEDALRAVVADPEDTWTADLGRTDYYVRGQLCVQVTRAQHRVVGIYRSGWAVARRPDETWADTPDSLERTGAKPGGSGTRYPTNRRELLERLRAAGFEVTTSGPTHGKITHPDVPGRFLPFSSTPSSQRYGRHVVTAVKRVFGIDVR